MIVRIRFGSGRALTRRKGKNGAAVLLLAGVLMLFAVSFDVLWLWRLCEDLGFAGDFAFASGVLSHWQVWMGAAAMAHYLSWRLAKYPVAPSGDSETPVSA